MEDLNDRPFLLYLANLPDEDLIVLFNSQPCTLAIFRMLTPISQQCILHMLFKTENDWKTWCKKRNLYAVMNALKFLMKLRIVEGSLDGTVSLNEAFRLNYLNSVMNGAFGSSGLTLVEADEKIKKAAKKDLYSKALERWECILRYLAMPSDGSDKGVSTTTQQLFQHIGFTREGHHELEITSLGFQFLLLNRVEQIWTYILYYLRFVNETTQNVFPVLEFLLKLTLCATPVEGPKKNGETTSLPPAFQIETHWPQTVTDFLLHLRELGVVFIRKRKDGFFFLTPLLSHLAESSCTKDNSAMDHQRDKGFLVVETNYRVYAYTNSALQLAVLSTFTEILYRFEDMSVGVITRDSVRRALQAGITADQIIMYLRANAHPETVTQHGAKSCIPITIVDQLRLWEEERKRLTCDDATIYSTFESDFEYQNVKQFTTENNILLWHNDQQRLIIVKEEGHALVKAWWKSNK